MVLQWETALHHLPSTGQIADVDTSKGTVRFSVLRMMGRQCSCKMNGKYLTKQKDMAAAKQWVENNVETLLTEYLK